MVILFVMCYVGVYVIFVVLFGFVLLVGACFVLVLCFCLKASLLLDIVLVEAVPFA